MGVIENFYLDNLPNKNIRKKYYYTRQSTYVIVNYDKNYVTFDDIKTGRYRSVVFSYPTKNVVCYSTPKSIPLNTFIKLYPEINDNILINEAIEGVSINLFYDTNIKKWLIATKSSIGGKYWFYGKSQKYEKQYTFLEMFIKALGGFSEQELNDLVSLEYLPKNYCYNFIMQDVSNNILLPLECNRLFLIGVYRLNENEVEYISYKEYQLWNFFHNLEGLIEYPKQYYFSNYDDLSNKMDCLKRGYMITNTKTGERARVQNDQYENLKTILKIKPEIQYQFLCLYRIGDEKLEEYLNCFPKLKKDFYMMRYLLDQFMKSVHSAYLSKYVYKDGKSILEKYESHVYKIHHNMYLPLLNKNTITKIRYRTVVEYFSKMEPRELIYILNWDSREGKL
jgi:hypothetical protein